MGKKSKRALGDEAEDAACNFLIDLGWEIIDRNYYAGHNEVDIIAKDDPIIVFVEVKMRTSTYYGSPIEFIDESKVERVYQAAEQWVQQNDQQNAPLRFDVIGIIKNKSGMEINHIQDAYR